MAGSPVHTRRRLAAMVLLTLLGAALIVALDRHGGPQRPQNALGPSVIGGVAAAQPFNYVPEQRAAYERDAAMGLSHVLFAKSPGGVVASARRTAHWRPIVDRVARAHRLDADTLEAIIMLESAGRPDARASTDLRSAVGLTQILAETGQNLLGLHIDVKASERLTRGILRGRRVRQREAVRRRVDERFDPAKAIEGAARYLDFAKGKLGRDDLAVVSYHMGVGNLQQALIAYGKGVVPYAQLYFDSSPLRHAAAWRKLASLGDDSSTYLWRVLAARDIMRLYRSDPGALQREAVLQSHKASAEEVLHPAASTPVFADPFAIGRARASGDLRVIDKTVLAPYGLAIDPSMGALAGRIKQSPRLYRALRPPALAVLQALGAATRAISGSQPLIVTSTVRDKDYQRVLVATDQEATHAYSLHTTGYAFDIARVYRSRAQALAFQWVLDRLTARGMIAWIREPQAIHITVASR
ncbi:MAG TPA: transglycosylase SLT domain-containing protein [Solirubrobacteraceae bacterium]